MPTAPFPLGNRYQPLGLMRRSRLGPVYEARDESESGPAGRLVAVQLLDSQIAGDAEWVAELRHGFVALQAHRHPNLVDILGIGRDERFVFVVMERLEGATARAVLDDAGPLPFEEAVPIVRAVGAALDCLHSESIIHGNVDPKNVLLVFDDGVRLLDVVPVRAGWASATHGPTVPIDVRGDPRDDVFGLACLAYELMAGRHPFFSGCTPAEAARAGVEPAPLASLSERRWLALSRGLALEAERRTRSVAAFLDDWDAEDELLGQAPAEQPEEVIELELEPALTSEPQPAVVRPFAPAPRTGNSSFRNRDDGRRSGTRAIGAVVALAILAIAAWLYYPALREATDAVVSGGAMYSPPDPAVESEPARSDAREMLPAPDAPSAEAGSSAGPGLSGIEAVAAGQGGVDASAEPLIPRAAPAPAPADIPVAATADRPVGRSADAPGASAAESPRAETEAPFVISGEPLVSDEDAGFVTITVRRTGSLAEPGSVFWWTSQETATAGDDYADFGTTAGRFGAGEDVITLLVPLVDDAIAEPLEHFFVYVGRRDAANGSLDPLARARIEIRDDD